MAENEREDIYGVLRDFDRILDGRVKLTSAGTTSVGGRPAVKYVASLGPAGQANAEDALLPPLLTAKGRDDSASRRLAFDRNRQPKSIQGYLAVDARTGVVLESHLEGRLTVAPEKGKEAGLRIAVDSAISDVGKEVAISAPTDFLPDADKPAGIAAALDRFGIPHRVGRRDAGAEPEEQDEEP
jgi:hypothetical protein